MYSLEEIFSPTDDFCNHFEPARQKKLIENGQRRRRRSRQQSLSEIMTISVAFHLSSGKNFKSFYLEVICHSENSRG
ncbi:MAG: hypothetical protein ACFCAD_13555 [Pleurocapsa sp.]